MDRSIAFALLSMVFAGVTAVLAKAGMRNVSGDVALLVRTCLIFGLVWGNAFAFRQLKELPCSPRAMCSSCASAAPPPSSPGCSTTAP